MTRGLALLLVLLAALAPATAAPAAPGQPAARILRLVEQTAFVAPEGDFDVRLSTTGAPPDAKLRWTVHDRVRNRTEFTRSITGEGLRQKLLITTQPLAALAADTSGTVVVRVSVRTTTADTARLRIAAGVYPVELELLDSRGSPVDRIVTHLLHLPDPTADTHPLGVTLVLPLHGAPALGPAGTTALTDATRRALGIEIAALLNHPALPLAVVPTPEMVDALAEGTGAGDDALLGNLREAVDGRQLVATPYVRVDSGALVGAGLGDLLADELARGRDVLGDQLAKPDPTAWVGDPDLDGATAVALGRAGVTAFVVPDQALSAVDEARFPVTLTQPFELDADGHHVRAVAADDQLASHVGESGDAVLDAHVLLADVATLYFDAPRLTRAAVVSIPTGWTPNPDFLAALLNGLEPTAAVQPMDLATLFATVPEAGPRGPTTSTTSPAEPLRRTLTPAAPPALGSYPADLAAAQRDVATYRSVIGPASPRADPLDERLLVSASADLSAADRNAYLKAVRATVTSELAKVDTPTRQTITLTAREGRVPMLVRNRAGYPMHVVVRFESERLAFPADPDGHLDLTLDEETTRVEIAVRARASGDVPLDVRLTAPDGRELRRARYRIRSTAVSGLGIVLSMGAGLFLLFWWAGTARRARRRRGAPTPAATTAATSSGAGD